MKTQFMQLNLGILLAGLIILTSFDYTYNLVSTAGINVIYSSVPSLAIKATKYAGYKIPKFFKNSSSVKKDNGLSGQKAENSGHYRKAMPISIGITDGARLVSSKP